MSYARNQRRRERARGRWFPGIERTLTVDQLAVLPALQTGRPLTVADLVQARPLRGIHDVHLHTTRNS